MRHPWLRIRMSVAGIPLLAMYALFALALAAGGVPLTAVVVVSAGFVWIQYHVGRRIPLWSVGATDASEDRFPDVHSSVERLAAGMGIETPRLMIADMGVPNAFTVGRRGAAVIVVGSELLYALDDNEVESVLAHELAHVRNRDVVVMVLGHSIASILGLTVEYGVSLLPSSKGGNVVTAWLLGSLTHLSAMVFVLAVSRYREFIADADAAEHVGVDPLVDALETMREVGRRSPADVDAGVAAFCVFGGERGRFTRLFDTHPPIDRRIERLRAGTVG